MSKYCVEIDHKRNVFRVAIDDDLGLGYCAKIGGFDTKEDAKQFIKKLRNKEDQR